MKKIRKSKKKISINVTNTMHQVEDRILRLEDKVEEFYHPVKENNNSERKYEWTMQEFLR